MKGLKKSLKTTCVVSALLGLAIAAQAQTGGVTSNFTGTANWGDFNWGGTSSSNTLTLYGAANLTTSNSAVGGGFLSHDNLVRVTDGSYWSVDGDFQAGIDNLNNYRNRVLIDGSARSVDQELWFTNPELSASLVDQLSTNANITMMRIGGNLSNDDSEDSVSNLVEIVNNGFLRGEGGGAVGSWLVGSKGNLIISGGPLIGSQGIDEEGLILINAGGDVDASDFDVGEEVGHADLRVLNGANADVEKVLSIGSIGGGSNQVIVGNATLQATTFLLGVDTGDDIGIFETSSANNFIGLYDGGFIVASNFVAVSSDSNTGVEIDAVSGIITAGYKQDGQSRTYLRFLVDTNFNAGSVTATNLALNSRVPVQFIATTHIPFGEKHTNFVLVAESLELDNENVVDSADLENINTFGSEMLHVELIETNQDVMAVFSRQLMSESAGLAPGMPGVSAMDEIDEIASDTNNVEFLAARNMSTNVFNLPKSARAAALTSLYGASVPTFAHGQSVNDGAGLVMARSSAFHMMLQEKKASGAPGPHAKDQGVQGWILGYGGFGKYETDQGEVNISTQDYDQQIYGTVMGLDNSFGNLLMGIALGFGGSSLESDANDESDAEAVYGVLYASYGTEGWFGDFSASVGQLSVENSTATSLGTVSSDPDATQMSFYAGIGKEWRATKGTANQQGWRIRPSGGIRCGLFDQDAYVETGMFSKNVAAYDRWSYLMDLGVAAVIPKSYKTFAVETELRAKWLYEFNHDEERVGYTLVGGLGNRHELIMQAPDEHALDTGIAVRGIWANGWQLRGALDGQFGDNYTAATVSGSILREF